MCAWRDFAGGLRLVVGVNAYVFETPARIRRDALLAAFAHAVPLLVTVLGVKGVPLLLVHLDVRHRRLGLRVFATFCRTFSFAQRKRALWYVKAL